MSNIGIQYNNDQNAEMVDRVKYNQDNVKYKKAIIEMLERDIELLEEDTVRSLTVIYNNNVLAPHHDKNKEAVDAYTLWRKFQALKHATEGIKHKEDEEYNTPWTEIEMGYLQLVKTTFFSSDVLDMFEGIELVDIIACGIRNYAYQFHYKIVGTPCTVLIQIPMPGATEYKYSDEYRTYKAYYMLNGDGSNYELIRSSYMADDIQSAITDHFKTMFF